MFLLSGFILVYIYKLPLKTAAKQNKRRPWAKKKKKKRVSGAERRNEKREFMTRCSGRCREGKWRRKKKECYKREV